MIKIKMHGRRICFIFWIGLILTAVLIWFSKIESEARRVNYGLQRLGHFMAFSFPDGLPKEITFIDALLKSTNYLQLGQVVSNGKNPLPDFLPEADYHYEKKLLAESLQSPRVVCWTSVGILTKKQYFVLYSNWTKRVVWDSSDLPEFKE